MSLTRREFNKTVLTATAGFGTSLYLPALPITDKSIVAIAKSPKLKRIDNKVNKAAAVQYLNKAMCKITGRKTAKDAWKSLFKPHESVGIKLSCLPGPPLSSSHGVVWAIVDGLISAGIKGRHIYIWERTDC
ncbi:MAG: hypothetical protein GY765_29575 [bacterium]|nr:hypothetical protein [bacterium]